MTVLGWMCKPDTWVALHTQLGLVSDFWEQNGYHCL